MINYDSHVQKRNIQKKLLPLVKKRRVVALAGPNILSYVDMLPKQVREVEIWENDGDTMLMQLSELHKIKGRKVTYRFGDVINADVRDDTFYDLDFCRSMKYAHRYIAKFKDCSFMITCSNRDSSFELTGEMFLLSIKEMLVYKMPYGQFDLIKTDKNDYLYAIYRDTQHMTSIFKFH